MPITVRSAGDQWVIEYRGQIVGQAATEFDAKAKAVRGIRRLLKLDS